MRGLFIVNPSSGRQNIHRTLRHIVAELILQQICNHIDTFYTEKKDDALHRAESLKPGEYDFVCAVGGDGTLNEVANGMILSNSDIPMAILSAGTVNDFATYMELPQTTKKFCQMIKDLKTLRVDVGKVNDKYFINVLAAGMLTDVAYKVPKDKKAIFGRMAYYLECAKELPGQMNQYTSLHFESEQYTKDEDTIVFLVTNTKSVGGFPNAAPSASVTDGYLDVLVARKTNLWLKAPQMFIQILQGDHPNSRDIEYFRCKNLKVSAIDEKGSNVSVDYDGELLESGLPIEISVAPKALHLVVPKQLYQSEKEWDLIEKKEEELLSKKEKD